MSHEHHHKHECCEHEHKHHHSLKRQLILIIVTAILLIGAVVIEKNFQLSVWQLLLIYLVPYLLIGHETLKEAVEGIVHGDAFNEHFLMSIATIGALSIGFLPGAETQFPEAVFVMLFFQVGELFEGYAEGKSRESIAHLMDIRPDIAHVERQGQIHDISPEQVESGSIIVIRPGEKVPLDGVVIEGKSALNTVALTGESVPRDIDMGDEVISGCVNLSGVIKVRTTKSSEKVLLQRLSNWLNMPVNTNHKVRHSSLSLPESILPSSFVPLLPSPSFHHSLAVTSSHGCIGR